MKKFAITAAISVGLITLLVDDKYYVGTGHFINPVLDYTADVLLTIVIVYLVWSIFDDIFDN